MIKKKNEGGTLHMHKHTRKHALHDEKLAYLVHGIAILCLLGIARAF
jgi:hypothetical protein